MRGASAGASGGSIERGVVRDVTQEGASVVETARGLLFVHGGLPGEEVSVRVGHKRGGVLWGELQRVLVASPARIDAPCELASRCGGCPLMTLAADAQQALKLEHVQRALRDVSAETLELQLRTVGPALGYRRRVRLAFRKTAQAALLGHRQSGSHRIVDAERCVVLDPALGRALELVRRELLSLLDGSGELELVKHEPDAALITISCDQPARPQAYRAAQALSGEPGIAGVALRVQDGVPASFGATQQTSLAADGLPLSAPARSFAQANAAVNAELCSLVSELAEPSGAHVIELYAGHGNFTVNLARTASALEAFELDAQAADACRENLRARGLEKARVHTADAAQLAPGDRNLRKADVIVVDPPRGGAPGLAALAARTSPARIVYVSCHMTTLARDLRALALLGYRADRAYALDMFPQTAHVEAVVRLQR
jgi:23S rRNA (uracil1939-C5)-methyltransferase